MVICNTKLNIERLNNAMPLIKANPRGWDNGFTLNPTAVRLERSLQNDRIIHRILGKKPSSDPKLRDGIVAVLYRGIPNYVNGLPSLRSSVGMAVFTPELKLIKRYTYPVVFPTDDPTSCDYNGVEDQRVTRIGDMFYMTYCGFNPNLSKDQDIHICMAKSRDLVHWTKLGPVNGNINDIPNKDAVLFPKPVNGHYLMLHRPCVGGQGNMGISLAISDSPTGRWKDIGTIIKPFRHPGYTASWLGAGSTPISIGNNCFLCDYHTGNYYATGERDYFANYSLIDFNKFDINNPEAIVQSRSEALLVPETQYERNSPWPHEKTLNCVFPCGSYIYNEDIILVYGGADAYVLAAKVNKNDLLAHLDGVKINRNIGADNMLINIAMNVSSMHPEFAHA